MQAATLVVVTGARAGHTLNHARRIASEALRELGDAGAALGVQIAVQPMHRQSFGRWTFLTSLEATLDLLDCCRHPQVGLVFDLTQFGRESVSTRALTEIVPFIKIAGLSENCLPVDARDGRASTDSSPALAEKILSLEDAGYRGWYEVQLLGERNWLADYERLIADCCHTLRTTCPRLFGDGHADPVPSFAAPGAGDEASALRFADEPAPPF